MSDTREITCVVYESRKRLRWSWRFKFVAANNRKLGHEYNNLESATKTLHMIVDPNIPVRMVIHHRDGTTVDRGRIRG